MNDIKPDPFRSRIVKVVFSLAVLVVVAFVCYFIWHEGHKYDDLIKAETAEAASPSLKTPNLDLDLPGRGEPRWTTMLNENFKKIDAAIGELRRKQAALEGHPMFRRNRLEIKESVWGDDSGYIKVNDNKWTVTKGTVPIVEPAHAK